ncbi:hypothetical protein Micbo1qcDRAFT_155856 [Microdochium bolleyi]|uniref:Uncharacterized protein n=1 Tax=Microdochium bolleyi TaxID=196109 RepID=A0A136JIW1_9PEZI|nr:hypothetical protein Micbo1qcDRAFT_155856 [Microdochium bolleyi]
MPPLPPSWFECMFLVCQSGSGWTELSGWFFLMPQGVVSRNLREGEDDDDDDDEEQECCFCFARTLMLVPMPPSSSSPPLLFGPRCSQRACRDLSVHLNEQAMC